MFEQTGGSALAVAQHAELKAAVQGPPAMVGIELANRNWRVAHRLVWERFGVRVCRRGCLNYLHRLGFAFKRPKKRLVKSTETKREPSWRSTPPCGTRRDAVVESRPSPTSQTSVLMRNCGARGR